MRAALVVVAAVVFLAAPAAARGAAPNVIVVSGPGIARPIVLDDWNENLALLLAVANAPRTRADLRSRPRLDLAEFWAWGERPRPRSAAGANQHGTLYPSYRGRPAAIILTVAGGSAPLQLTPRIRAIFARHGVPLRR